jgi:hypothetical protein
MSSFAQLNTAIGIYKNQKGRLPIPADNFPLKN